MKLTYILILGLLFGAASCAKADEGLYFEAGFSIHDASKDNPEVLLDENLSSIGLGYTFKLDDNDYFEVYIRHTSSLLRIEQGNGLNQIGIQVRSYL